MTLLDYVSYHSTCIIGTVTETVTNCLPTLSIRIGLFQPKWNISYFHVNYWHLSDDMHYASLGLSSPLTAVYGCVRYIGPTCG